MPWDASGNFTPYDPFGDTLSQPRQPAIQQLDPQQTNSALTSLMGAAGSGLQFAGGTLEKLFGGRAIRGLLGGVPRELLSLIPGSDVLGITDPSQRVSGEDLLRQWGVLSGEGEKGTFELRDLLGPALEIGLDPATYLSFGASALTKAGKAAEMAGELAPSMAGRIAAGQGGLMGLGLPFSEPSAVLGTGQAAQKVAEALGDVYSGIRYSRPGTALAAMFQRDMGGTTSPILQQGLGQAADATRVRTAAMRDQLARMAGGLSEAGEITPSLSGELRSYLEAQGGLAPGSTAMDVGEQLKAMFAGPEGAAARERALGIPTGEIENYAPRQMTPLEKPTGSTWGGLQQPLKPFHVGQIGREDILTGITGETAGINELVKDPEIRALAMNDPTSAQQIIRERFLGMGPDVDANRLALNAKFDASLNDPIARMSKGELDLRDALNSKWKQAQGLQDWITRLDPQYAEKGLDFFGNNLLTDVERRLSSGIKAEEQARALHGAIAKVATTQQQAGPGSVPVIQLLKDVGLTSTAGARQTQMSILEQLGKISGPEAAEQFLGMHVPADVANELSRYVQAIVKPETVTPLLKVWDSITNLTKAGVTAFWPAKYTRDFGQGAFMNWIHDASDPRFGALNPMKWLQPYKDASTVLREGGSIEDASLIKGMEGLTDEQASKRLAEEMYARKVAGPEKLAGAAEAFGGLAPGARHAAEQEWVIPGSAAGGLTENILQGLKEGTWNPLDVSGVAGKTQTTFKPAKAGMEAMEWIDDMNRGAAYIAKRRQGYLPDAAADVANKAQYDYTNLSSFEKSTMRRVMPFYNFTRQNIPAVFEQLMQQPGGKMASTIKAIASMRRDQGFVPEYIGEGLTIPVGQEDETGKQRFLSNFGLPMEDVFGDIATGPSGATRTLQNILSETNPLIKAPLELAAGKQFFSGRELSDLYGSTGNQLLDQALYNSPLSRFITTGRTLIDERKGLLAKALNVLSPVKLTDVDLDKQRGIAARELIEQSLAGNPNIGSFQRLYVKPGDVASLSPEDLLLMRLYTTMEAQRDKAAKQTAAGG